MNTPSEAPESPLTAVERRLLVECLMWTEVALQAAEPPHWDPARSEWATEVEHGPRWDVTLWFGQTSNAYRRQLLRSVYALEARGLMATFRRWGRKLTHVGLTDRGVDVATALRDAGDPVPRLWEDSADG